MDTFNQTIAALSTPPGESGIAVVRVSGDRALELLGATLRLAGTGQPRDWEHRRVYFGSFEGSDGDAVDDVMAAVMRSPHSYTGEDIVELSCHGGTAVVSRVLERLYALGARPAQAGEFTRRAFLNGKMDLIQAEAVSDLIHARSELQRRVAHRQMKGALSQTITTLADEMVGLLGVVEANIDFIEEDIDTFDVDAALVTIDRHRQELDQLLESVPMTRPFREGYRAVIAGPVNAGKSSIFNRLVGEERAIVTDIPGTTRDVLREPILLDGLLFVFADTAGMRGEAGDRVESLGMGLAAAAVRDADVVFFVLDGTAAPDTATLDAISALPPGRSVVVINKADLDGTAGADAVRALGLPGECVTLSARTGEGVDKLAAAAVRVVGGADVARMARERVILNARIAELLQSAASRLSHLRECVAGRMALELLAVEVRGVLEYYETASGRRYRDDVLDVIFSRFCIGK